METSASRQRSDVIGCRLLVHLNAPMYGPAVAQASLPVSRVCDFLRGPPESPVGTLRLARPLERKESAGA